MKRCEYGHYFDDAKHTFCPACGIPDIDIGRIIPREPGGADDSGAEKTRRSAPAEVSDFHPLVDSFPQGMADAGVTVSKIQQEIDVDPVVGWLVCVKGPDRGRDFRIKSDKNFIGRSNSMDISIRGDETISRRNHAALSYNYKKNIFKLYPGAKRGLVFVNDEELITPKELAPYDCIEIGNTRLLFVPFCGERFQWQKD